MNTEVENGVEQVKRCHQCHRDDIDRIVECNTCQSSIYCFSCITEWYPKISEEEVIEDCPVCCNNCNCKACLLRVSPKEIEQNLEKETETNIKGLWRGLAVGPEAKELLQSINVCYPNTFERVQSRSETIWIPILKHFHVVIKGLLETSVDSLTEDQITKLELDLKECERLGFDLSWAHKRLGMVKTLKFENVPLPQQLKELKGSFKQLAETVVIKEQEFLEAHEKLNMARLEVNGILQEVKHKFGDEYDVILHGYVGSGMLPGY